MASDSPDAPISKAGLLHSEQEKPPPAHVIEFYEDGRFPAEEVADFLWEEIGAGGSGVVLAAPEHAGAVRGALAARGAALDLLERADRLVFRDAREDLRAIMAGSRPDGARFAALASALLDGAAAAAPSGRVGVFGELVALLANAGNVAGAAEVERLWGEALAGRSCRLTCAYPLRCFEHGSLTDELCRICEAHDAVARPRDPGPDRGQDAPCTVVLRLHSRKIRAEIAERQRTEAKLSSLLRMSEVLASSLDYGTTVANVLRLAVPALGDFGFLDVLDGDGRVARAACAPGDPEAEALLGAERSRSTPGHWTLCALSGGPVLHAAVDDAWMQRAAAGPEDLASLRRLAFHSMIAVPLESQERIRGGLTLFHGRSGRRHGRADLELARELAYRAAAALENARLYRERTAALERQAEADRRKDEFLAMLGHELRNPLAPILTALQVMELRRDPTSQRERDIIRRQAEHLTRLVDDLLDISRIVRGQIVLRREAVEISSVLTEAIEVASPLLEHFAHKLSLAAPSAGAAVRGDRFRLAQIFANLLTNAAKYTSRGGRIAVEARREAGSVVVAVSDNGSGIAREMLPVIFEPFVQGGRTLDRSQGGLGLGLALIKILTELHGGTVSAQSEGPGRGSVFTVRLPAAAATAGAEDDPPPPASAARPVTPAGRGRVLVVDDNRDAADMLAIALQEAGYEVEVAYDAPGALARAEAAPPQCAVVDIGLPVMDGWELATRLRASQPGGGLRLVAVTGYGQESDREKSRRAGFDAHLVKPLEIDAILHELEPEGAPAPAPS